MNIHSDHTPTTRRNAYHKPLIAMLRESYNNFMSLARFKTNNDYYYGRLYHLHPHALPVRSSAFAHLHTARNNKNK